MGAQGHEFYSEEEAEQILKLAATKFSSGGVSRDDLMQSAAELGISPEALMEAERTVMENRTAAQDLAEFDAYQKREFFENLTAFVTVNGFLIGIDLWTNQFWVNGMHPTWSLLPFCGWGIGLFFDVVSTFVKSSSGYREEFDKWKRRRDRKARKAIQANATTTDQILDRIVLEDPDETAKLMLIKRLREETGMGLKEAKDTVDDYVLRHPGVAA
jgi:hypothetical protein